ncbi:unnamed protein product [Dicrocoelium dendriticum]|nr:unnamed protein product [Dicrocoelium dendriticum]
MFSNEFRLTACTSLLKLLCLPGDQESRSDATDQVTPNTAYTEGSVKSPSFDGCHTTHHNEVPCSSDRHNIRNALAHKDWNGRTAPTTFILPPCPADDPDEDLPSVVLEMAIVRCLDFIHWRRHQDIDHSPADYSEESWPWECFFAWYQKALRNPHILKGLRNYRNLCHKICMELRRYRPQLDLDGVNNVWIVKPAAKSRGRGVVCYNQIGDFLHLMRDSVHNAACRFVAQKYVEKPLLICKTKFDIRQWFLVTDWSPLTVWWYRTCYLRFCSREFTLDDFSEAIHLCNNSIQGKYMGRFGKRELPSEFMWTLEQFRTWLTKEGHGELWQQQIEPSMKRAIIDSLLCAQEEIEARKNSFALYGADFMLTEDFRLWLIEINSSPCMSPSTAVTAKLTSSVLEDTLKVVIDRRSGRNCDTGQFELIYRQDLPVPQVYTGLDLRIEGTAIHRPQLEVTGCPKSPQNAAQSADKSVCVSLAQIIPSSEPSRMTMQSRPNRVMSAENYCSSYCSLPNIVSQSAREDKVPAMGSVPSEPDFTSDSNFYQPSPQPQQCFSLRGGEIQISEHKEPSGVCSTHHGISTSQSTHLSLKEVKPTEAPKRAATRLMASHIIKKLKLPETHARGEFPMSANELQTEGLLPPSDRLAVHNRSPHFMYYVNATTCKPATAPIVDASQERRNSTLPKYHVAANAPLSFSVHQGTKGATELKSTAAATCSSFRPTHEYDSPDKSGGSGNVQDVSLCFTASTRQVYGDKCSNDKATRINSDSNRRMWWTENRENPKAHQIFSPSRAPGDQSVRNGTNNSVEIRGPPNLSTSASEYCLPKRTTKWNPSTCLSRKLGEKAMLIKMGTNRKPRRKSINKDIGTAVAKCAGAVKSDNFKVSPNKMDNDDDDSLWEMAKRVLVKAYRLTAVDEIHGSPKSSKKQRSINKPTAVAQQQISQRCIVSSGTTGDSNFSPSTRCRRTSSVTLGI